MKMPFGKHRGTDLSAIPDEYLDWLRGRELREPLRSGVNEEWAFRFGWIDQARTDPAMAQQIVKAGYRALTQQHHPDHGGSTDTMQRLNAAMTWLRARITEGVTT